MPSDLPPPHRPARLVAAVRQEVMSHVGAAVRDEDYDRLRTALDDVPGNRRGPGWREVSILLDAQHRRRPKRTHRRMSDLRARRTEADDPQAFDRFYTDLRQVLGDATLTGHGYGVALAARDPAALWRDVGALADAVEELGAPCFLVSGTLLGLVRDGRAIDYDDDVDLGVLLQPGPGDDVGSAWVRLRAALAHRGMLAEEFDARGLLHTKSLSSDGVGIDLFPAWIDHGMVHVWPSCPGSVAEECLLPLRRITLAGTGVWVPRRPEPLLEANYGPGWATPDPTWTFEWPREQFADLFSQVEQARQAGGTSTQ